MLAPEVHNRRKADSIILGKPELGHEPLEELTTFGSFILTHHLSLEMHSTLLKCDV